MALVNVWESVEEDMNIDKQYSPDFLSETEMTKEQLIAKLNDLRLQIEKLEKSGAGCEETEIKTITEELKKSKEMINENREKMQVALNSVSTIIQSVTKHSDISIRVPNSHLIACCDEG